MNYGTAQNKDECKIQCENYIGCNWYSYNNQNGICLLFSSCDQLQNQNQGVCTSAQVNCGLPDDASDYILIGFGQGDTNNPITTIELFDFKNKQTCHKSINGAFASSPGKDV